VSDQRPQQRLHTLIGGEGDLDEAGVLEARSKEVVVLASAVDETDLDLPEVVLRELARESLEANHRRLGHRADRGHKRVEGGLGADKAALPSPTEQLQGQKLRVVLELLEDEAAPGLGDRGTAQAAAATQGRVVDVLDQRLGLDAADLADRDAAALGHVRLGVSGATENLDLMAHKQREHRRVMHPLLAVGKGVICRESGLSFVHFWPPSKAARISGMKAARVSGTDSLEGRRQTAGT
jgi:hypothetical protein